MLSRRDGARPRPLKRKLGHLPMVLVADCEPTPRTAGGLYCKLAPGHWELGRTAPALTSVPARLCY